MTLPYIIVIPPCVEGLPRRERGDRRARLRRRRRAARRRVRPGQVASSHVVVPMQCALGEVPCSVMSGRVTRRGNAMYNGEMPCSAMSCCVMSCQCNVHWGKCRVLPCRAVSHVVAMQCTMGKCRILPCRAVSHVVPMQCALGEMPCSAMPWNASRGQWKLPCSVMSVMSCYVVSMLCHME